jgi:hypothetical protein
VVLGAWWAVVGGAGRVVVRGDPVVVGFVVLVVRDCVVDVKGLLVAVVDDRGAPVVDVSVCVVVVRRGGRVLVVTYLVVVVGLFVVVGGERLAVVLPVVVVTARFVVLVTALRVVLVAAVVVLAVGDGSVVVVTGRGRLVGNRRPVPVWPRLVPRIVAGERVNLVVAVDDGVPVVRRTGLLPVRYLAVRYLVVWDVFLNVLVVMELPLFLDRGAVVVDAGTVLVALGCAVVEVVARGVRARANPY